MIAETGPEGIPAQVAWRAQDEIGIGVGRPVPLAVDHNRLETLVACAHVVEARRPRTARGSGMPVSGRWGRERSRSSRSWQVL